MENVILTLNRPQDGEVVAVANSGRVREAAPPQAGPVPRHFDDGRAAHAPDGGDLPALHGHGASDKNPTKNGHEKTPNLHHADLHLFL